LSVHYTLVTPLTAQRIFNRILLNGGDCGHEKMPNYWKGRKLEIGNTTSYLGRNIWKEKRVFVNKGLNL